MNLEKLSINKFIIFNAVLRYGSAAIAAKVLKIPLIKVHNDIKSMEKLVGSPLLLRNQRKIELTEAGKHVANIARAIIEALHKENTLDDDLPNDLIVAAPHGFCSNFLPQIISEFHKKYPTVIIRVLSGSEHLDFMNRDVDIVIGDQLQNRADLSQHYLYTNSFMLFASNDYLQSNGIPKDFSSLDKHTFVHYFNFPYPLHKINNNIKIKYEVNNFSVVIQLIADGHGIGLLSDKAVINASALKTKLQPLFSEHVFYRQKFMFITRKFSHKSRLTNLFFQITSENVERVYSNLK